jgi:two-component system cell cycle sensor histidine kinase/response regulator CckA
MIRSLELDPSSQGRSAMSEAEAVLAAVLVDVERLRVELEATSRERDRLEAELSQALALAAVGRLAAGLAHDFSNFVTTIAGHGELLLRRLDAGEGDLRAGVEGIQQTAAWGATLAQQLLAACRQEDTTDTVVNLNDVVTAAEPLLRRLLGGTGWLVTRLDPEARPVRANRVRLEQVVFNLVATASRGLSDDGLLTIATRDVSLPDAEARSLGVRPGRYVVLRVMASGGQLETSPGGLITEAIAARYGGVLRILEPSGPGATLEVYLPGLEDPEPQTFVTTEADPLHGRETVLVVEDEVPVRELIRDVLRLHGYTVLEAQDGDEALTVGERHPGPIHLLMEDVVVPGVPAPSVVRRLTGARPGLKVLYMSGYTDELIRQHGLLRLGPDFLQKPFTVDALARKVRELLDAD